MSNIRYVPLDKLRLSPKNTRQQHDPEAIEQMAASIKAHGLLQNLIVEHADNEEGMFEVIAGGTRLAALKQLAQQGEHAPTVPIPVRFSSNGEAHEASAAENLVRTRLPPADEFDAFKRMADNGKSRAEIATHFGVAEIVVSRSLKLANVAPDLFDLFRQGAMDLDQLQALALTDDHELQRKAWFGVKNSWERSRHELRERITNKEVSVRKSIVKFVGLDEYEAAGGFVRRDLFNGDAWITDAALLDKLAADKLEAIAEQFRADGWAWVETHLSMDYSQLNEYPSAFDDVEPDTGPLSPEQEVRKAEIEERLQEIEDAYDQDGDPEGNLQGEAEDLEQELVDIEASTPKIFPDHVRQQSGVLVFIDNYEGLRAAYGRLQPGQKLAKDGTVTGNAKPAKAEKTASKPAAPTLSQDMTERLHLHQRAALRAVVASDANLAIELLLAQLLFSLFGNGMQRALFDVRVGSQHRRDLDGKAVQYADVKASAARKELDDLIAELRKQLPKKAGDIPAWLATRTVDQLHHLLALVAAVTLDPSKDQAKALAAQQKLDMATRWDADAAHYLGHVPKALIVEAVREVRGAEAAAKVEAMKRDAAAAEAGKLLAGSGWLPKPLRGPGYKLRKPGSEKPAPAKKSTAPAKKPAKKAAKKAVAKKAGKAKAVKK